MSAPSSQDERVLIVAPVGADAENMRDVLVRAGLIAAVCPHLTAAAQELAQGCGALLLTEEAFDPRYTADLADALERQPAWSDLPVVIVVRGGQRAEAASPDVRYLRPRTNVTLAERPLRKETLISTVNAALRARRRQLEVRDLLHERDEILASLEQRVAERTAKLLELNTELETFSYSVSHDLRSPLRTIESFARILSDDYAKNLPPDAQHYLQRIAKNAERMDRLMQDVLTFSRIGRAEVNSERLDLDAVMRDVIEQYTDLAASRDRIIVRQPLGVVSGHGPGLIQCFSNLLQNALKFARPDTPPRVEVYSEPRDGMLRVYVKDNGIGVDPAYHARIFGLFERAGPAGIPGTGVGLAIVKKAAERMGGRVGVHSQPGQGAAFWLELPTPGHSATAEDEQTGCEPETLGRRAEPRSAKTY